MAWNHASPSHSLASHFSREWDENSWNRDEIRNSFVLITKPNMSWCRHHVVNTIRPEKLARDKIKTQKWRNRTCLSDRETRVKIEETVAGGRCRWRWLDNLPFLPIYVLFRFLDFNQDSILFWYLLLDNGHLTFLQTQKTKDTDRIRFRFSSFESRLEMLVYVLFCLFFNSVAELRSLRTFAVFNRRWTDFALSIATYECEQMEQDWKLQFSWPARSFLFLP